ncbi:MAG TPA: hypothetical protein VGD63_15530 [Steroidobacteraceae bacterium]
MRNSYWYFAGLALLPALVSAQSAFEGTWRPDPQKPSPTAKPDIVELVKGEYACQSCSPSYKVTADGRDHAVAGSPYYDNLSVSIVDGRTIIRTAKKAGRTIAEIKDVVSVDGTSKKSTQTVTGMMPQPVELTSTYSRVAAGPKGSHSVSGQWREIQTDLTRHDEDTTYKVSANKLTMSDRMGRSFSASLDGADAPYSGDSSYNSVSIKLIDKNTIEESDKKDGKVVQINRWTIDPDGTTIHARFDDTHGHIQEQVGHRLP